MKSLHSTLHSVILLAMGLAITVVAPAACDDLQSHLPTASSGQAWHTLRLEYAHPSDIIRLMHWGKPAITPIDPFADGRILMNPPDAPITLPEGVTRIYALEGDNSLLIEATPEGFARVREIVKNLDLAPRTIQFKVQFVRARSADVTALGLFAAGDRLQAAVPSGPLVIGALKNLLMSGGRGVETRTLSTTNGGAVSVDYQERFSPPPPALRLIHETPGQEIMSPTAIIAPRALHISLSPCLNQDDTITLTSEITEHDTQGEGGGAPRPFRLTWNTGRTVHSGEMLVIGGLLTDKDSELLVFITPTLLPTESAEGNDSGQKRGMMNIRPTVSVAP